MLHIDVKLLNRNYIIPAEAGIHKVTGAIVIRSRVGREMDPGLRQDDGLVEGMTGGGDDGWRGYRVVVGDGGRSRLALRHDRAFQDVMLAPACARINSGWHPIFCVNPSNYVYT